MEIKVLNQSVRLLQPEQGFRTSLDSVMLAAACPVKAGQSVLDLGCGVGAVGFCVLRRVPGTHITGIDIQSDYVTLAQDNIPLNDAAGRAEFICGDVRDYAPEARFDHVVTNPPFLKAGHHIPSPVEGVAKARGHVAPESDLKDWIDAGFRNLKSGGSLTIIHRADEIDRIIQALGRRFGAVEIIPLWPHVGEPARRIIVRAVKDRKSPAMLKAGIVLHDAKGAYTEEADKILRGAQPIL